MPPGIVVLDNNCYGRLEDERSLDHFRANLRIADLVARPSEVNLLEAAATSPPTVQQRLLATIREVSDGRPLLPWPFWLLKRVGEAILNGEPGFPLEETGKEWYLTDPAATRNIRARVMAFQADLEGRYSKVHDRARPAFQKYIKQHHLRDYWASAREFLEQQWCAGSMREHFTKVMWDALQLPGRAPVELLMINEVWLLLLDAEGVAVYQRAIAHQQPKRVHRADLIQLVYLAASDRRVLATADAPFLEAAGVVLRGRYPNARAVHISELLL